jgi:hypothetical protein
MDEPVIPTLSRAFICSLVLGSVPSLADESRDPTRPPVVAVRVAAAREPLPVLSAIMGAPSARVAIFNSQLVRSGSQVGTFLIVAILEDGVRYRHAGTTQELHLAHSITAVKKPSAAAASLPPGTP